MRAILHPPETRRLPLRYGPDRQRARREAERIARVSAVVFTRWLARRGHTNRDAAIRLGVSDRALAGWLRLWREEKLQLRARGRRYDMISRVLRHEILTVLQLMGPQTGVPTLQGLFPRVPRAALADL